MESTTVGKAWNKSRRPANDTAATHRSTTWVRNGSPAPQGPPWIHCLHWGAASPPEGSTAFPTSSSRCVFKHVSLWGTLHIQTTTVFNYNFPVLKQNKVKVQDESSTLDEFWWFPISKETDYFIWPDKFLYRVIQRIPFSHSVLQAQVWPPLLIPFIWNCVSLSLAVLLR